MYVYAYMYLHPTPKQVNFVPQGSLLDLVIYPHTQRDMAEHARTEDEVSTHYESSAVP